MSQKLEVQGWVGHIIVLDFSSGNESKSRSAGLVAGREGH